VARTCVGVDRIVLLIDLQYVYALNGVQNAKLCTGLAPAQHERGKTRKRKEEQNESPLGAFWFFLAKAKVHFWRLHFFCPSPLMERNLSTRLLRPSPFICATDRDVPRNRIVLTSGPE
jgi:hypothetical protein